MPMVPAHVVPRSERMSPKRLEATTTSNRMEHEMRGEDVDVVLVPPHVREILAGCAHPLIPEGHGDEMPLDLVAEVRCFFTRRFASSKAKLRIRSTPAGS